jgi:hypothetical protein
MAVCYHILPAKPTERQGAAVCNRRTKTTAIENRRSLVALNRFEFYLFRRS